MRLGTRSGSDTSPCFVSRGFVLKGWGQVLQRIYKYGGQPVARDFLGAHYGRDFENAFGKKTGKAIMHSTAGR